METDEKRIQSYLRSLPGQFISGREIARRASGKSRFRDNPNWAVPVLKELLEKRKIEKDSAGHFRLAASKEEIRNKRWVSPQMKKILEQSGKDFTHVIKEEDLDDPGGS